MSHEASFAALGRKWWLLGPQINSYHKTTNNYIVDNILNLVISCHSFVKDEKTTSGSTILSFHELNWYCFIVCSCCWQWNCISSYTLPGGAYILCHLWNRVDFKHSIHKENELLKKSLFVHSFPISAEIQWKTSYFCSWVMQLSSSEHYTWSSTANQVNQYPHQTDLFRLKTV